MYKVKQDVLSTEERIELKASLLGSPYRGRSQLGPEFVNTEGFSLVFRRDALASVLEDVPYMERFFEKVLMPKCNAFYINPLLMAGGSEVGVHIDCRLVEETNTRIIPNLVSVYYLETKVRPGDGLLTLNAGKQPEIILQPQENSVIYFKGDLLHKVGPVAGDAERISIVCEQYNLPPEILEGFPRFDVLHDGGEAGHAARRAAG